MGCLPHPRRTCAVPTGTLGSTPEPWGLGPEPARAASRAPGSARGRRGLSPRRGRVADGLAGGIWCGRQRYPAARRGRTVRRPPDRPGSRGDTGASGLGSRGDGHCHGASATVAQTTGAARSRAPEVPARGGGELGGAEAGFGGSP